MRSATSTSTTCRWRTRVYVHDRIIFEARLTGQGYNDLTVPVTLREKGKDQVLATQLVKVDPQGKPVKVQMMYQPTEPGEKIFVMEVPVQPDEAQPAVNNRWNRPRSSSARPS